MKTKIADNIQEVRRKIVMELEPDLADEIARDGVAAIRAGMGTLDEETGIITEVTPEWERLMKHFAETDDELKRLCGQELKFNQSHWGMECLVYIAGDSICTAPTTWATGTKRSMLLHPERNMLENLDREFED